MRANKIFQDSEQNNEELLNKTDQLEKCTNDIEMQILNNEKCKKIQQSDVDKLKGSNEGVKSFSYDNIMNNYKLLMTFTHNTILVSDNVFLLKRTFFQ